MELYLHKVQYYETDQMAIVHHSNYIRWMEEARIDFLSRIGCDYKTMEDNGIISPVTAVDCRYKVSARFGDTVAVRVWVEEFRGAKLKIGYEMTNQEGTLVAEGRSEHCFISREGKLLNLKRSNPDIFNLISQFIAE